MFFNRTAYMTQHNILAERDNYLPSKEEEQKSTRGHISDTRNIIVIMSPGVANQALDITLFYNVQCKRDQSSMPIFTICNAREISCMTIFIILCIWPVPELYLLNCICSASVQHQLCMHIYKQENEQAWLAVMATQTLFPS